MKSKKDRLAKLFLKIKNNPYFESLLDYSENDIRNNALEIFNGIFPISKQTIIENFKDYINYELSGSITNSQFYENIMNINNLSNNHDKVIVINGNTYFIETTSGSTGNPFPVIKNANERLIESSYLNRCRKQICNRATINNGFLMIHPVDEYLKSINYRDGTNRNFDMISKYLVEKNPLWIFSTALLFRKFYNYLKSEFNLNQLSFTNLNFIELTSQKLDNEEKKDIETVLNTKIINNFGCREVWNIAYECICGNMHVNNNYLIVELVDEKGETIKEFNKLGHVVITNLSNYTMPFVKYYLGDLAYFSDKKCSCGCKNKIIVFEDGRYFEKILNSKYYGNVIFRKILRTLIFHGNIRDIEQIKIIQDKPYHINVFLKKECNNDANFEKKFISLFNMTVENGKQFEFSFIYYFPNIYQNNDIQKDNIFINYLKGDLI